MRSTTSQLKRLERKQRIANEQRPKDVPKALTDMSNKHALKIAHNYNISPREFRLHPTKGWRNNRIVS